MRTVGIHANICKESVIFVALKVCVVEKAPLEMDVMDQLEE